MLLLPLLQQRRRLQAQLLLLQVQQVLSRPLLALLLLLPVLPLPRLLLPLMLGPWLLLLVRHCLLLLLLRWLMVRQLLQVPLGILKSYLLPAYPGCLHLPPPLALLSLDVLQSLQGRLCCCLLPAQ